MLNSHESLFSFKGDIQSQAALNSIQSLNTISTIFIKNGISKNKGLTIVSALLYNLKQKPIITSSNLNSQINLLILLNSLAPVLPTTTIVKRGKKQVVPDLLSDRFTTLKRALTQDIRAAAQTFKPFKPVVLQNLLNEVQEKKGTLYKKNEENFLLAKTNRHLMKKAYIIKSRQSNVLKSKKNVTKTNWKILI